MYSINHPSHRIPGPWNQMINPNKTMHAFNILGHSISCISNNVVPVVRLLLCPIVLRWSRHVARGIHAVAHVCNGSGMRCREKNAQNQKPRREAPREIFSMLASQEYGFKVSHGAKSNNPRREAPREILKKGPDN